MRKFIPLLLTISLLSSCTAIPTVTTETELPTLTVSSTLPGIPSPTSKPIPTGTPLPTSLPQKFSDPIRYGSELIDFPEDVDPLTGLRVSHPEDLASSAVLVSISNSPVSAKPQAGLSFASMVNEFFLGYGTTRYLSVFYGERARRISNLGGDCPTDPVTILPEHWLGGRVWLDESGNNTQDDWEVGVPAICLVLSNFDGDEISRTGTTPSGYYMFDTSELSIGEQYVVTALLSAEFKTTQSNIGYEDQDSDFDSTNLTALVSSDQARDQHIDLGLVAAKELPLTYLPNDIAPDKTYVGPIRSGRLSYNDFGELFPTGCLVFASAGADILPQLDPCEIIFGEEKADNPNTSILEIDHLRDLSLQNNNPIIPINYSGNLFDSSIPENGADATTIHQYFHQFSQAKWVYDPLSQSYLRYTDDLDGSGKFHPDVDRLTNHPLAFENVIYLFTDYEVYRHNQYDISLCCGLEGWATLFRDGKMYRIRWSTNNREFEKTTGVVRPIKFIGDDKLPFPLKPGNTWISLYTTNSLVSETSPGSWQALFALPDDLAPEE